MLLFSGDHMLLEWCGFLHGGSKICFRKICYFKVGGFNHVGRFFVFFSSKTGYCSNVLGLLGWLGWCWEGLVVPVKGDV